MANAAYVKNPKEYTSQDIALLVKDSSQIDRTHFAKVRKNLRFVAGRHFINESGIGGISFQGTDGETVRITSNQLKRVTDFHVEKMVGHRPRGKPFPANSNEIEDRKGSELHKSVLDYALNRMKWNDLMEDFAKNDFVTGEVVAKVYFDRKLGNLVAYDQNGEGVFEGDICAEPILPFNLLRPPGCSDIRKAEWLCVRKLLHKDVVKSWVTGEKKDKIEYSSSGQGNVQTSEIVAFTSDMTIEEFKDHILIYEFFFKKSPNCPEGWYILADENEKYRSEKLPGGIFPIVTNLYEKEATSPRGVASIIRDCLPYQIDLNRIQSHVAQTQMSVGQYNLLLPTGATLGNSIKRGGVKAMMYNHSDPPIELKAQVATEYLPHMKYCIEMIERIGYMNQKQDKNTNHPRNLESLAYQSIEERQIFSQPVARFERFVQDFCEKVLELARFYYTPGRVVEAVGRSEAVNISEFKNSKPMSSIIKIEAGSERTENSILKSEEAVKLLQYVKDDSIDKALVAKAFPHLSKDENFKGLTIKVDTAINRILALNRGEGPFVPDEYEDKQYTLSRIIQSMRESDYKFKNQNIIQNYEMTKQAYQMAIAKEESDKFNESLGPIPTGGPPIYVDRLTRVPGSKTGQLRKEVVDSVSYDWFRKQLEKQGQSQEAIQSAMGNEAATRQLFGKIRQVASERQQGEMPQPPQPMQA